MVRDEPDTSWIDYFREHTVRRKKHDLILGVIIYAQWMPERLGTPCHIALAIKGDKDRICIATTGTNTADYLLGRIAVADLTARTLLTSNHEERPILATKVKPEDLGLSKRWQRRKRSNPRKSSKQRITKAALSRIGNSH